MDRERGRSLIAGVPLFRGLEEADMGDVLDAARRYEIGRDAVLFRQDDAPDTLYVLAHGRVKVSQLTPEGQQVVIRYIGPGDMLGCVAVCGGTGYPGTATAVADSVALGWSQAAIRGIVQRFPSVATNALSIVGGRLQESLARVRELSTEKVERRIAHAILRLVRQAGRRVDGGVQIDFPVSRQDISEMTGTTLHTVSRVLSAWEHRGLVEGGRQRIVILKPHDLVAIAEDL